MKGAMFLVIVVVVLYVLYHMLPKKERADGLKFLAKHMIGLGGWLLVVVVLIACAYYLPVSQLMF